MLQLVFDGIRIIVCLGFLLWSSSYDYVAREVPNKVWKLFLPIALLFCIFDLYLKGFGVSYAFQMVISIGIPATIFILLFYLGFYGGADAKAMICLSIAIPISPRFGAFPLLESLSIFPLSILNNTLVFSVSTFPYALISNVIWKVRSKEHLFQGLEGEPIRRKLFALLFCVKKKRLDIKSYDTIAEDVYIVGENRTRRIKVSWRISEGDDGEIDIESLPENVFVDFSLPMLIFVTSGFIASLILGDIIFWFIGRILRFSGL